LLFSGYIAVRRVGMKALYRAVRLATGRILRDLNYCEGSSDPKHCLDLFLPEGTDWPILIFIHGGGLDAGDKNLRVHGEDVYSNIGRFYASQGIGVAVINYRLQPAVKWREQVEDVAQASAWVFRHLGEYGGNIHRLFIGGHSAGAHLAARVALDANWLMRLGFSPSIFSGVIAVSGAGFDLTDTKTYDLGQKLRKYETRFRCGDPTDEWKRAASPISYINPGAPPFLILFAEHEKRSLKRQSELLHEALVNQQVQSELLVIPRQNHSRMVLALSRPDRIAAGAIIRFIGQSGGRGSVLVETCGSVPESHQSAA
jgi:arylformamidase